MVATLNVKQLGGLRRETRRTNAKKRKGAELDVPLWSTGGNEGGFEIVSCRAVGTGWQGRFWKRLKGKGRTDGVFSMRDMHCRGRHCLLKGVIEVAKTTDVVTIVQSQLCSRSSKVVTQ